MKKIIYYFGLLFFLCSSFFAYGIEVNADSFVKADREEEEESFELSAPNMGRVYTKEKVMIKRDLSSLDSAVDSLEEEQIKKTKKTTTKPKTNKRKPASLNRSLSADYGDMEIRWQKK